MSTAKDPREGTWRRDLRRALEAGVPRLSGVRLGADGLPDLAERETRRRYSHWLAVRLGIARPETVLRHGVWLDVEERGVWNGVQEECSLVITVPCTQASAQLWEPAPARDLTEASCEECFALALLLAASRTHGDEAHLAELEALDVTCREARAAPDALTRTWVEDVRLARASGVPELPGARLRADGLPDLEDPGTRELYSHWLAVRLWLANSKTLLQRGVRVVADPEEDMIRVEVPGLRNRAELGWNDPHGPRLMGWTGRWAAPSAEDVLAFALRCGGLWKDGPRSWLGEFMTRARERAGS